MSDERLLELIENKNKDYMLGFIKGIININKELHKQLEQLEQLKENNRKYQEVTDKLKNIINEMINFGYIVENGESAVDYMATGSKSEFGTRAKVLLDILKEVE